MAGTLAGPALIAQQLAALVGKNLLVKVRNRSSLALQLGSAFVMLLLVLGIEEAVKQQQRRTEDARNVEDPEVKAIRGVPDCSNQYYIKLPCYTFAYSGKGDPTVDGIVEGMRANNPGGAIPADRVIGFPTVAEKDAWLLANPQRCQAGIEFLVGTTSTGGTKVDYGVQVNGTVKAYRGTFEDPNFYVQLPLQASAEREIARATLRNASAGSDDGFPDAWEPVFRKFPHPPIEPFSLVGAIGPTFIFAAAMFTFVLQLSSIVGERELKLRQALRNVGTSDFTYWMSWVLTEFLMDLVQATLILAWGSLFGFRLFLENDSSLVWTLLFMFMLGMSGFGFFVSVFLRGSALATMYGFVVFLIGFVLTLVVGITPGGEPFTRNTTKGNFGFISIIFSLFPPTLLAKGLGDLGRATASSNRKGISWSQRERYCSENWYGPPTVQCDYNLQMCYERLTLDFFLYTVAAMYLDQVLPNEFGVSRPFWFPVPMLLNAFGIGRSSSGTDLAKVDAAVQAAGGNIPLEEDVAAEEQALKQRAGGTGDAPAMLVQGLVKSFGGACGKGAFHAVKGNWFEVKTGELFGLLGPNGAGKTTTINLMTGVLPCTAGDGFVYGSSVATQIGSVRKKIGVCPQFDILWGELTGEEHLYLFSALRGLPLSHIEQEAAGLLDSVKLQKDRKVQTRAFSGGMRRRLSVAIALIGDPQVVFLDEPTTGMDPIHRRHVWDIILDAKEGRAIVLTTHSMEEADALADRIGIIAAGRLRCLASSVRLKSKFGTGYSVAVAMRKDKGMQKSVSGNLENATADPARKMVNEYFKDGIGAELEDAARVLTGSGQYMHFRIPRDAEGTLPRFLSQLEDDAESLGIADTQVSLATLDEVFLSIAKKAAMEGVGSAAVQIPVQVPGLPAPVAVTAQVGQDVAEMPTQDPNKKVVVRIRWSTDENGNIVYSDHTVEVVSTSTMNPMPDSRA